MTTMTQERKQTWTQYLNTGLLSILLTIALSIWGGVRDIQTKQQEMDIMLSGVKLQQEITTAATVDNTERINEINSTHFIYMQEWVSSNFVRKNK